jgi:hypothetical protein
MFSVTGWIYTFSDSLLYCGSTLALATEGLDYHIDIGCSMGRSKSLSFIEK